jgi:cobalt-zinc-cadmium resistance protein CzcA
VRFRPEQRDSIDTISHITVATPNASGGVTQVPLSEVASIRLVSGASFIYREHQTRYVPIKFSVRDRDLGSAVAEAQARIAQKITLPPGYSLEWAGEMSNLKTPLPVWKSWCRSAC